MIKVTRICDTCKEEYEQDIINTPSRIGNVIVYPVDFRCSDCELKHAREVQNSLDAMKLGMDLENARRNWD